jgi:hypothetical protein
MPTFFSRSARRNRTVRSNFTNGIVRRAIQLQRVRSEIRRNSAASCFVRYEPVLSNVVIAFLPARVERMCAGRFRNRRTAAQGPLGAGSFDLARGIITGMRYFMNLHMFGAIRRPRTFVFRIRRSVASRRVADLLFNRSATAGRSIAR